MPPKKPAPKGSGASPQSPRPAAVKSKAAPSPPKAAPGKKPAAKPSGSDNKGLLFAAFEGLIQIHPNEANARNALIEDEEAAFDDIMLEEMESQILISEGEARVLVAEDEDGVFGELSFEESTQRQQLIAAMLAKKSAVGRRSSIVDPGLGPRIARKKSRLDSELEAEESRLAKAVTSATDPKAAQKADREKWLSQTTEVRDQIEETRGLQEVFQVKQNGKKFESKQQADERKALDAKLQLLQKRLKKLEELEANYQEREAAERLRVRRCSNLKGVDIAVITGERSVLQKSNEIDIRRRHEEQNELLDESMFRQMVVQSDREAFSGLNDHEQAVRRRAAELHALHGPSPRAPQPPPKANRRLSVAKSEEQLTLPPIPSARKSGVTKPSEKSTPRRPHDDRRIPVLRSPNAHVLASSEDPQSDHGDTAFSGSGGPSEEVNQGDYGDNNIDDVEIVC
jgi:hypothetical protein